MPTGSCICPTSDAVQRLAITYLLLIRWPVSNIIIHFRHVEYEVANASHEIVLIDPPFVSVFSGDVEVRIDQADSIKVHCWFYYWFVLNVPNERSVVVLYQGLTDPIYSVTGKVDHCSFRRCGIALRTASLIARHRFLNGS